MILKPYPEYKDSGVPWLGEIPQHQFALPHKDEMRRFLEARMAEELGVEAAENRES
jgi:hypothetical protein